VGTSDIKATSSRHAYNSELLHSKVLKLAHDVCISNNYTFIYM